MKIDDRKYLSIIPFMGTFIIITGLLNSYSYYDYFDIQINEYLNFSETLILFSKQINPIILQTIFIVLIVFIYSKGLSKWKKIAIEEYEKSTGLFDRVGWFLNANIFIVVLSFTLLIITSFVIKIGFYHLLLKNLFHNLEILIIVIFLVFEYRKRYFEKFKRHPDGFVINILFIAIIILLNASFKGSNYALSKDYFLPKENIEVVFSNNEFIKSNNNLIFLGQTENYIILFEKIGRKKYIYPRNRIVEIRIIENTPSTLPNEN